jgi:thiosulfate/3-mercaptopyruvate sulfurtransferase
VASRPATRAGAGGRNKIAGGGISATVDLFLLHQLGFDNLTLYDGSMGEWAKDSVLPIEKG